MSAYVAVTKQGEVRVEVKPLGGTRYEVEIGGKTHIVDALRLDHGVISLIDGTRSYSVEVDQRPQDVRVLVRDSVFYFEMHDERRLKMKRATAGFSVQGKVSVMAPMPGKVVKVLVKNGDTVTEGQGLLVVEAMKMENEIKSPKAGKVGDLAVAEGQAVEGGLKMLTVD